MENKKERDPCEVIKAVLEKVPVEETDLRACLNKVLQDAAYLAPEDAQVVWVWMGHILNAALPMPPKEEWQKEIYRIVTMKEPPQ